MPSLTNQVLHLWVELNVGAFFFGSAKQGYPRIPLLERCDFRFGESRDISTSERRSGNNVAACHRLRGLIAK